MDLMESNCSRIDFRVGRHKEAARNSVIDNLSNGRCGPSDRLTFYAVVLPVKVLVDRGQVPDARLQTVVVVVHVACRSGDGPVDRDAKKIMKLLRNVHYIYIPQKFQ